MDKVATIYINLGFSPLLNRSTYNIRRFSSNGRQNFLSELRLKNPAPTSFKNVFWLLNIYRITFVKNELRNSQIRLSQFQELTSLVIIQGTKLKIDINILSLFVVTMFLSLHFTFIMLN